MQPRKLLLGVLVGGPALGLLMGLAVDPDMVPGPEPTWRKMRPDPIFTEPQRFVDTGPQDLSPTWHLDRMPTWKRRALERELAAYAAPPPLPEDEPIEWEDDEPRQPELAEAAYTREPADDARAAPGHHAAAREDEEAPVLVIVQPPPA